MKHERTLYDVLEVSQHASLVVVKAAYRSLAQVLHPDKNSGTAASGARLSEINAAYATLSEPARRLLYDQSLGLSLARPERRGTAPSGPHGIGRCSPGKSVSRPFGFRPLG